MSFLHRIFFEGRGLSRRQWLAIALLSAAAAFLAYKYLRIGINTSGSLNARVFIVLLDRMPTSRGDYVVYRSQGEGGFNPAGSRITKLIAGLPGDRVEVSDQGVVSVQGTLIGRVLPHASNGTPLQPIDPGVVPPGHLFVAGQSPRSFDSRYKLVGAIRSDRVIGTAYAVF
jgi:conjugal transfer pilin signal peptidase TrbI